MSWMDLLRMSGSNLKRRKLRTFLTVLGVVIGTTSIVVMISLGLGMQESLYREVEQSGGLTSLKVTGEESGGGITLSGGEVLQQHDFAAALLKEAHKRGLHCAAETTGFAAHEVFSEFIQNIDLLLFDMKHWDREMHHEKTGVYNDIILENMRYALEQKIPVIARIPVIPGFNANKKAATGMAALLKDMGITEVHLLPFHQFGEKKYEQLGIPYEMSGMNQLHPENLQAYLDIFLKDGLDASFR